MSGALLTALLLGLALGVPLLLALIGYLHSRGRRCPECGRALPALRWPASKREALPGGWTCAHCGTRVDRNGERVPLRAARRRPPKS